MWNIGNFVFWILLLVVLVLIAVLFIPQIQTLVQKAQNQVSPQDQSQYTPEQENTEVSTFKTLGISQSDPPDTKIYKLFKNFDSSFLSISTSNKIYYNSFILDLKGNTYNIYDSSLITNLRNGLTDFNKFDATYQIGSSSQPNCGTIVKNTGINFNNDCWSSSLDSQPSPCKIYVNSNTNNFDGNIRIKVVWYLDNNVDGRKVIYTIISLCDG